VKLTHFHVTARAVKAFILTGQGLAEATIKDGSEVQKGSCSIEGLPQTKNNAHAPVRCRHYHSVLYAAYL